MNPASEKPSECRAQAVRVPGHVRAAEDERSRRFAAVGPRQDVWTGPLRAGAAIQGQAGGDADDAPEVSDTGQPIVH